MKSYGSDHDLCILPNFNIITNDLKDADVLHEMNSFIIIEKCDLIPNKQDMCIGLGFHSSPYTIENCVSELFYMWKETSASLKEELDMEHNEYCPKDVKVNLNSLFSMMNDKVSSYYLDLKKANNLRKTQTNSDHPDVIRNIHPIIKEILVIMKELELLHSNHNFSSSGVF
ncbi:c2H2-type domain-containing protein [Caerostris extrusa]|uniref:C2H2-type domain-containing protein n=1 Tax=Caerostris extrusa TaxID=172846 RepID=A0AAV4XPQ3_CAEEX|nr:c2H2-type domain-containing protein [Caerostris extrusa]